MKKRINNSEIEKAKFANRLLFVLTILMLSVVIGGLIFYILYDKKLIKFDKFNNTNEEDIITKNETKFDVNLNNKEVLYLYNIVKISNNDCNEYIYSKKIDIEKLDNKCKFDIASNIYINYIINDNNKKIVSEDDVSYSYEALFGEKTYKTQEVIPYINDYKLLYNPLNKYYFTEENINNIDNINTTHELLLSVKKDNSYLYINSAVMYYDSILKNICKDYECNEIIEQLAEDDSNDYFNLYIKHNKDKLYNYKYKFKLDKNGFYKYLGYEKS